jgi:hypothetical protein
MPRIDIGTSVTRYPARTISHHSATFHAQQVPMDKARWPSK